MRIAFLFKEARRARLQSGAPVPGELFYGFRELAEAGCDVTLIEQNDLGVALQEGILWKLINFVVDRFWGLHARAFWQISRTRSLNNLNQYDALVVSQNSLGFALGLLKNNGKLAPRVVFILMGGLANDLGTRRHGVRRRALRNMTVLSLSRGEEALLAASAELDVRYLPFGVDTAFWTPATEPTGLSDKPYVLAVGSDPQRDYTTLLQAWRPDFPLLRIVTRLPLTDIPENVEIIAGHFAGTALSDTDIRVLYQSALLVIVPLHKTIQPSGQSVTLQAMACGRPVILTETPGLWDRELMVDDETCALVTGGDPDKLANRIAALLAAPQKASAIGARARTAVQTHLGLDVTARALGEVLGCNTDKLEKTA